MTILEILGTVSIPPLEQCGTVLSKIARLKTYYYKLSQAPECNSNDEALILINNVLIEVENCHSGMEAEENPDLNFKGRMYPIREDFITRQDGKIIARSKGNNIIIENNGDFTIRDRESDLIIIQKTRQN